MSKKVLFVLVCASFVLSSACQQTAKTNENINSTVVVKEPENIPPGFSTSPVPMSGNSAPGIPDPQMGNANNLANGTSPIPGIPDPKTIGKTPVPKKTPPIPGIPDEATLKKQLNTIMTDVNIVNNPQRSKSVNINARPADKSKLRKNIQEQP